MRRTMFCVFIGLLGSLPAMAASFDCSHAIYPDEKAICSSLPLNDMDVELSVKYHFLRGLLAMGAAREL